MNAIETVAHRLQDEELKLLTQLRAARRTRASGRDRCRQVSVPGFRTRSPLRWDHGRSSSFRASSWYCWMALNVTAYVRQWDPYPFILLNLVLSFQAAYAAPFIMMSQNRQAEIDRNEAKHDYEINIKAELEIELLHQKIDLLRETEIQELTRVIRSLEERLGASPTPSASDATCSDVRRSLRASTPMP